MNERIKGIYEIVRSPKMVLCVQKSALFTEAYRKYEGLPEVLRVAKAQGYMIENIDISLLDGDLICGAPASKPMGVEVDFWTKGVWLPESIESLLGDKEYSISKEEADQMLEMSDYWHKVSPEYKLYDLYDEDMWRWRRSGYQLPRNKTIEESAGMGYACNGMVIFPETDTYSVHSEFILAKGLRAVINEAKEALAAMHTPGYCSDEDVQRRYALEAIIAIDESVIRWANRYADLCEEKAAACTDEVRREELLTMAKTCRRVPEFPATTFQEALQFQWFIYLMTTTQTTQPLGRADQYLYPYYKADIEAGRIDDEKVLEFLQCFRLKFLQMKNTSGGQSRLKWQGQARWNSVTLGGVKRDGTDATNELTYLFLEAANRCRVPQHTLSLRIHKGTPEKLMKAALDLVQTGIGMPSFVSDESYIGNLVNNGVPLEVARDYYIIGCVDCTVPEGFGHVFAMNVLTLPFDTFLHNGYSPTLELEVGPKTGDICEVEDFDTLFDMMMEHQKYFFRGYATDKRLRWLVTKDRFHDMFTQSLYSDGVKVAKTGKHRELPYGIGPAMNIGVGAMNIAISMYNIKKLVFDEKRITMRELLDALDANWEGERNQQIRQMCLDLPKYGNDEEEVDEMVARVYNAFIDAVYEIPTHRGGHYLCGGVSITSHDPGGAITGATPDGRYAGEVLADGAASPLQSTDRNGPTAMLNSAMRLPQLRMQSLLLNMKLHPTALKDDDDKFKLSALIRTYFENGGKQIQFNVVDQETLIKARNDPDSYRDLIVRVAGYSTYFVLLSKRMQDEIIARTCNMGI